MTPNRTTSRSRVLLLVTVLAAILWPAVGSPSFQMRFRTAWVYLGEATLSDSAGHIRIEAKPYTRTFSDLQIRVRKHDAQFLRIRIHFADEASQDVRYEHRIPAQGTSRTIDLEKGNRSVEAIEFWYEAVPSGEDALIQVYGRG